MARKARRIRGRSVAPARIRPYSFAGRTLWFEFASNKAARDLDEWVMFMLAAAAPEDGEDLGELDIIVLAEMLADADSDTERVMLAHVGEVLPDAANDRTTPLYKRYALSIEEELERVSAMHARENNPTPTEGQLHAPRAGDRWVTVVAHMKTLSPRGAAADREY